MADAALWVLVGQALIVYGLVLGVHSLRRRWGKVPFYAVLGALAGIMSWVTETGVALQVGGITFLVGSTVFYNALILGVFAVYLFDGPRAAQTAILIIGAISILTPALAALLNWQQSLAGLGLAGLPRPSFRLNAASVAATLVDMVFLAIAWEFLFRGSRWLPLVVRIFLTLLGVMWLDVVLFVTGAFAGEEAYGAIFQGHLLNRLILALALTPFFWAYMGWQRVWAGAHPEQRPILAILQRMTQVEKELEETKEELNRRCRAEEALKASERTLRTIFDSTYDAIIIHDTRGDILDVNLKTLDLFGLSRQEALRANFRDDLSDSVCQVQQLEDIWRKVLAGEQQFFEWSIRRPNLGGTVPVEVFLRLLPLAGEMVLLANLRDISQHKKDERAQDELIASLEAAQLELTRISYLDGLTGVPNRRRFEDKLEREWRRAAREGVPLGLLMIDIDLFKAYNDTYGHQQGDECLRQVAQVLAASVRRPGDMAARYGGEEFAVLLPSTGPTGVVAVGDKIRAAVAGLALEHLGSDLSPHVTVSAGAASLIPTTDLAPRDLVAAADQALYLAKRQGRDQVVLADGPTCDVYDGSRASTA